MIIDEKTYQISKNNYYNTSLTKTQIIIGFSLRKDNNHIHRLQNKNYGETKKWNTYTISRDGAVYQHYDDKYYSDFLGIKGADKQSISIVLENMGSLTEPNIHNILGKYNWLNEYCENEFIGKITYNGYDYWEKFTEIQIDKLVSLCVDLCAKYDIPREMIDFQHFNKTVKNYRGILFRSNYVEDISGISPLFNIVGLNSKLKK